MNALKMISVPWILPILSFLAVVHPVSNSQDHGAQPNVKAPDIRTYKTIGATELKAHVFRPPNAAKGKSLAAIILLHGGGWTAGGPEWMFDDAKHFAGLGLVAVAGEYRLSNQKDITPLEAMSDARDLIRWVRQNAVDLAVDPARIAIYGVSAGGHLAGSAAVFPHVNENKISAIPDALLLLSPAVSIVDDHWPQILLGNRANVKEISPAENISKRLPPIIILEGAADTETPLVAVQRFCDRAKQVGGTCEMHVYPGVGHILTRNLDPRAQEQGPFDPDPVDMADAHAKEDAFLVGLGYTK